MVALGTIAVFFIGGILIARGRGSYPFAVLETRFASDPPVDWSAALKQRRKACS